MLGRERFRSPSRHMVDTLFDTIRQYPNVTGCFLGRRVHRGRMTPEPAFVCCVARKIRRRELHPKLELLPQHVDVRIGPKIVSLRTDVIEVPPLMIKVAPVAGPGDGIETSSERATIGVALQHPVYGAVVTTAGHLLYSNGQVGEQTFSDVDAPAVLLINAGDGQVVSGRVRRVAVNDRADYAIVQLDGGMPRANLYHDLLQIVGIHAPSADDLLGRRLFVLARNNPKPTRFLGYRGVMAVGNAGVMRNLIVTEFATVGGDSGACLIDDSWNVWGLLLGGTVAQGAAYSVFTSVLVPMVLESAQLA
jgi:hypothetical protein